MSQIENILSHYESVKLSEIEGAALLQRVDTKFILPVHQLDEILEQIVDDYRVLYVKNVAVQNYRTLYFDTPSFRFYLQHHNGKLNRHKIRIRQYVDSNLCYLEVKFKNSAGQTIKNRVPVPGFCQNLSALNNCPETTAFMGQNFPCSYRRLTPTLLIDFQRIALVSKDDIERITIDLNLSFETSMVDSDMLLNTYLQPDAKLAKLAIVEVKQNRFSTRTHFLQQMRAFHMNIVPTSFSKYCVGMMAANPYLKTNNFKQLLLHVNKIASC